MAHRTLQDCIHDLQRGGHLVTIEDHIIAELEAAEIQRRVYRSGGPAILFRNVKGCSFPMVSNLFGTIERARYLFRDTLERVQRLIELKTDPGQLLRRQLQRGGALHGFGRKHPAAIRRPGATGRFDWR